MMCCFDHFLPNQFSTDCRTNGNKSPERLSRHQSSDHGSRSFCGRCGSALFCVSTHHPEVIDIPLGNMDGPIDRVPEAHVFFDDRASWTIVADGLPRLGGRVGWNP